MDYLFVIEVIREIENASSGCIRITIRTDDVSGGKYRELNLRDFNKMFKIDDEIYNLKIITEKFNLRISDFRIYNTQLMIGEFKDVKAFWDYMDGK